MAKRRISKGRCYFCNAIFSKNVMTKHLKKCEQRKAEIEKQQKEIKIFHIMAEGRYLPQYTGYTLKCQQMQRLKI